MDADDARFFNHSNTPNTFGTEDPGDEMAICVALRDIQIGEELTADYRTFDTHPFIGFDKHRKLK
ncbi:MAG: SET domain-containing protein [Minisyncoccales bacterium]